jgi:hypothetical protein
MQAYCLVQKTDIIISISTNATCPRQDSCILRVINIQRCFHLGLPPVFGGVGVAHLFSFLCCFIFVCLRPVTCVPDVASVSGFSFRNYPFGFL